MAENNNQDHEAKHKINVLFWITLIRALLAFALGISLLFIPDKTHKMLGNFMGMFWLMSGILLVRQEMHLKRSKLLLVLGIVGALAGLMMVTRDLSRHWVAEDMVKNILGAVILLTGILHVSGGFQIGKKALLGRTGVSIVLGVFEIGLGAMLIISKTGLDQRVYFVATIWALLGGALLLMDAIRQRRQGKASS